MTENKRFTITYETLGNRHSIYFNDNFAKEHPKCKIWQVSIVGDNASFEGNLESMKMIAKLMNDTVRTQSRRDEEYGKLVSQHYHLKKAIEQAYNNEKTELGKSVLKQLMETIP